MPSKPARPPAQSEIDALFTGLPWHQRWEIFEGVFTPGRNPVGELCDRIQLPRDLRGKRILDIGAWHGCFSFECERRGAAEVIALSSEPVEQVGFERIRDAIGSKVVRYVEGSAYALDPETLGRFDLILFLGILYHLRHPLLAIDQLYPIADGPVLVETHVIDECAFAAGQTSEQAQPLRTVAPKLASTPIWQFYRTDELGRDSSNWFGPNISAVQEAFASAGFETEVVNTWGTRASFRATPLPSAEYLESHNYESRFESVRQSLTRSAN